MNVVALDYETYFDKDYTLKKSTTEEYLRDRRFELQLCSIYDAETKVPFVTAGLEQTRTVLQQFDWANTILLAHNAFFDGAIATWWCGIRPAGYLCTQQMWRVLGMGVHGGESLEAAINYGFEQGWNVEPKDVDALSDVEGVHWDEMTPEQQSRLADYCRSDGQNCYEIYKHLVRDMPPGELFVMSESLRCFVEPQIQLDRSVLKRINQKEKAAQADVMARCGVSDITELRSDARFFNLLGNALGDNDSVPTKINAAGLVKPAFAKSDQHFTDLLHHPDPDVRTLVEARLATKSTITESRTDRLHGIATRGAWPVHLKFGGAHTLRFSGAGQVNPQNLSKKDGIREALTAPPGCKYVVVDLSQIEARMVAYLAGQWDLVEAFRDGVDVYCRFGNRSGLFDYEITKKTFDERFLCKGVVLGGGFGSSEFAMERQIKSMAFALDLDVNLDVDWLALKKAYRTQNRKIVSLWYDTDRVLKNLARGSDNIRFGTDNLVNFQQTDQGPAFVMPNGLKIFYRNLSLNQDGDLSFSKLMGRGNLARSKLYGAKAVENYVQCLAGLFLRECWAQIVYRGRAAGLFKYGPVVLQVHDELVMLVKDTHADALLELALKIMMTPPDWAPKLPVAGEGKVADTYAEAK
jgi:DNA polymerase